MEVGCFVPGHSLSYRNCRVSSSCIDILGCAGCGLDDAPVQRWEAGCWEELRPSLCRVGRAPGRGAAELSASPLLASKPRHESAGSFPDSRIQGSASYVPSDTGPILDSFISVGLHGCVVSSLCPVSAEEM